MKTKTDLLFKYCYEGADVEFIKQLEGVNLRAKNDLALHIAAESGNLEIVKYLVDSGADIHSYNNYALRAAAECGHMTVVEYLMEKGEKANNVKFMLDQAIQNNSADNLAKYLRSL